MPLYFAYGSNLDPIAMVARCPGARACGPARLVDHQFFIMAEGYAALRRDTGATVHGLLWDVPDADLPMLDDYEEVAAGLYSRVCIDVESGDGPVSAFMYEGSSRTGGVARPGYMETVIAAAEASGLPDRYCDELRQWLPQPE